jgi:hypothetical protein
MNGGSPGNYVFCWKEKCPEQGAPPPDIIERYLIDENIIAQMFENVNTLCKLQRVFFLCPERKKND